MSFNKILIFFCAGLPLCTAARVLQIALTLDRQNGFFFEQYKVLGMALTAIIALVCVFIAFCGFKAYKTPKQPPKANIALVVLSALIAISLVGEALNLSFPMTITNWQIGVIRISTVICAFYFAVLAFVSLANKKLNPLMHIVPIAYSVVKTIFTFIGVSSLALTSDNVFLMAGYSLLMLFFINYGKLYNGLDSELNFRKILATGMTAAIVCISQSAGYFLVNVFASEKYLHIPKSSMITLLLLGVFIIIFTVSHFKENKKEHI